MLGLFCLFVVLVRFLGSGVEFIFVWDDLFLVDRCRAFLKPYSVHLLLNLLLKRICVYCMIVDVMR